MGSKHDASVQNPNWSKSTGMTAFHVELLTCPSKINMLSKQEFNYMLQHDFLLGPTKTSLRLPPLALERAGIESDFSSSAFRRV